MKYIADLHIHSHYSMATSKRLVPEYLEYWARLKGIDVIGTGDCIHPGWVDELKLKLEPCENGFYRLRDEYRLEESRQLHHDNISEQVYFILTGELSSIYKKGGRVRKVHNLCVFPDFESLTKVQSRLDRTCNIRSDGRPILGVDSKAILDMVLESSETSFLIPAHIWTPWFSVLGSRSGFDSIDECFEDLTEHIFALETGLSSDPPMNRYCSILDKFRLVSNSDAHSPEKLGREANLFDTELSYRGLYDALKFDRGFLGTIEFYPQEGKYHYDGHRKCGIVWNPLETARHGGICPVCGKEVTKGVMYRIAELGDRNGFGPDVEDKDFYSITRLPDLIAEITGQKSSSSKKVEAEYHRLIRALGSEFHIFLDSSKEEIRRAGGELLEEGIGRLREGRVCVEEGYDGEFGTVKVFSPGELAGISGGSLFSDAVLPADPPAYSSRVFDIAEFQAYRAGMKEISPLPAHMNSLSNEGGFAFTGEQISSIEHHGGPCMVIAGPGSGKTRILTERIKYLASHRDAEAGQILALTFSNKAAREMKDRVGNELIEAGAAVSTFHYFGLTVIRDNLNLFSRSEGFRIIDDDEKIEIIQRLFSLKSRKAGRASSEISSFKQGLADEEGEFFSLYQSELADLNVLDVDDLIYLPLLVFEKEPLLKEKYNKKYRFVLIDEFQDINASQYRLIRHLVPDAEGQLFVIGDPDQAIYSFRGADVKFVHRLSVDYPSMKLVRLSRSFRCPGNVLRAAGQVIDADKFLSGVDEDVKVNIEECATDRSEAEFIASQIERLLGGVRSFSMDSGMADGDETGLGFSDFAVLCRSSFMFAPIIKAFADHGVAYQIVDNEPFYRREPYSAALDAVKKVYLAKGGVDESLSAEIQSFLNQGGSPADVVVSVLEYFGAEFDRDLVLSAFRDAEDLDELFKTVSLRRGSDDYMSEAESVSLMTIHSAKGLEFNTVFIPGCEDGINPFLLFRGDDADLKEEERIFYVALTRTKNSVYLSHAKTREYHGRILEQKRSRFLGRIEKKLIDLHRIKNLVQKKDDTQLELF